MFGYDMISLLVVLLVIARVEHKVGDVYHEYLHKRRKQSEIKFLGRQEAARLKMSGRRYL